MCYFLGHMLGCAYIPFVRMVKFKFLADFFYTHLNVKTVLYQTNQFSVSTFSM